MKKRYRVDVFDFNGKYQHTMDRTWTKWGAERIVTRWMNRTLHNVSIYGMGATVRAVKR